MKHFQTSSPSDYYRNRKLLRELKDDNVKFRPSVEDLETWFNILNEQIFGNKLEPVKVLRVKYLNKTHAFYNYWPKKENKDPEIEMNKYFESKKIFVEILAHEMIHHFQYSYNEPLGHGPSFWLWSDIFKLKGLTLHKVA